MTSDKPSTYQLVALWVGLIVLIFGGFHYSWQILDVLSERDPAYLAQWTPVLILMGLAWLIVAVVVGIGLNRQRRRGRSWREAQLDEKYRRDREAYERGYPDRSK